MNNGNLVILNLWCHQWNESTSTRRHHWNQQSDSHRCNHLRTQPTREALQPCLANGLSVQQDLRVSPCCLVLDPEGPEGAWAASPLSSAETANTRTRRLRHGSSLMHCLKLIFSYDHHLQWANGRWEVNISRLPNTSDKLLFKMHSVYWRK